MKPIVIMSNLRNHYKIIKPYNSELTSHQLDHVLEQYYLKTETPTMEYVHSLCALASDTPLDLQPILECSNLEQLLERTTKLLESDINTV